MINYSWEDFDADVTQLCGYIKPHLRKYSSIFAIPRGALPLAVKLSYVLDIPLFIKGQHPLKKGSLVVDDIADSGRTLIPYIKENDVATIYKHIRCPFVPTFWVRETSEYIIFPWEKNVKPSKEELAWLAGFLDGEGSFIVSNRKNNTSLTISTINTDKYTIQRVAALMEHYGHVNWWTRRWDDPREKSLIKAKKDRFKIAMSAIRPTQELALDLLPYLVTKKEAAEKLIRAAYEIEKASLERKNKSRRLHRFEPRG